jgi:hypothetical protein
MIILRAGDSGSRSGGAASPPCSGVAGRQGVGGKSQLAAAERDRVPDAGEAANRMLSVSVQYSAEKRTGFLSDGHPEQEV